MDLYSRKIIAWTLSKTLEVSCVIETINKAKARRKIEEPLILHSDRGSQFPRDLPAWFKLLDLWIYYRWVADGNCYRESDRVLYFSCLQTYAGYCEKFGNGPCYGDY